jgi:hypothetical protein
MEPKTNTKRGRPIKYVDAAAKEQAIRDLKLCASKKYYATKSAQCCEKQRQYYEQHREKILQKVKENCLPAERKPGCPRKVVDLLAIIVL